MTSSSDRWWSSLPDECPITLEPLSTLPYPPFKLTSTPDASAAKGCDYYFDGLALATYIVSQGTFTNPLTREPIGYQDCVHLDDYLSEHIYQNNQHEHSQFQLESNFSQSILGQRNKVSVREAWVLRDSIKVKVDGDGNNGSNDVENEQRRRRADALRNEAAVALRGLFVFGHHSENNNRGNQRNEWNTPDGEPNSEILPRAAGGFNLHHTHDSNLNHSWGLDSMHQQQGLSIIDDDEVAYEAADLDAWREVQESFPYLSCSGDSNDIVLQPIMHPSSSCGNENSGQSELLQTVRETADLTSKQERENANMRAKQRQRYFFEALERKRNSILAQKQAKADAASLLLNKKQKEHELQSAKSEIDRWRAKQWETWERVASKYEAKRNAEDAKETTDQSPNSNRHSPQIQNTVTENQESETSNEISAVEKAAAKKAVKRQRAKERAKEKKRLERSEKEKNERALALQKKKAESATKCGSCGDGILDCGFEKFGVRFCSAKCARSGPSD